MSDPIDELKRRIERLEAEVARLNDPARNQAINIAGDTVSQNMPDVPGSGFLQALAAQGAREVAAFFYDNNSESGQISTEEWAGYLQYGGQYEDTGMPGVPRLDPGALKDIKDFLESEDGQTFLELYPTFKDAIYPAFFGTRRPESQDMAARFDLGEGLITHKWGEEGGGLIFRQGYRDFTEGGDEARIDFLRKVSIISDILPDSTRLELINAITSIQDPETQLQLFDTIVNNPVLATQIASLALDSDQYLATAEVESEADAESLLADGTLYRVILESPELINELSQSPLLTQVIQEMFKAEGLREILVTELFGDVESEENPIQQTRAELQAKIDEVKTEFNVVKASAVEASIAATASAGASIASALSAARAAAAAERAEAAASSIGTSDSKETADGLGITRKPNYTNSALYNPHGPTPTEND
jgi:hypothetical protein